MSITIPDLRVEEAELIASIKKLKKEDDQLQYYTKLYIVRTKLLEIYHQKLPKNKTLDNFESKQESYDFYSLQQQYFNKYLETLNNHPVFYDKHNLYDLHKIQSDILNVKKSLIFIEEQLYRIVHILNNPLK